MIRLCGVLPRPDLAAHRRAVQASFPEIDGVGRIVGKKLAAYLASARAAEEPLAVPPLHASYSDVAALGAWIARHQPDAIVSGAYYILDMLRELGLEAPRDLGVACPCIPSPDTELSGIFEDWTCLGEIAVDTVVAMLNRGERGVPARPHRLHVEGLWLPGCTLRLPAAV